MNLLIEIFTIIIVYLGVICGFGLSLIAPEEIRPGKKSFKILLNILISVILALFIYSINSYLGFVFLLLLLITTFNLSNRFIKYIYPLFAIIIFFSVGLDIYPWIASLVFIMGFPIASIEAENYVKDDLLNDWKGFLILLLKRYNFIVLFYFVLVGVRFIIG